jgi:hypothetical protein
MQSNPYINAAGQTELGSLQSRNQMAQALMAQSLQPQQGADASTAIGKIAAMLLAKYGSQKNDAAIGEIYDQAEADRAAEMARIIEAPTPEERSTAMLQSRDPQYQKMALALMGPQKPMNVGRGGAVVDPKTGKVIYQAPEQGMTPYQEEMIRLKGEGNDIRRNQQGGGVYRGTSMDAQNMNILLSGDPSTPEYAAAYAMQTQPRTMMTDQGLVTVTPQMPASIRPPVTLQGGVAPTAPQAPQQPASPSPAPKVETIPGTEPLRSTETMRTAAGFLDRMTEAEGTITSLAGKVDPTDPVQAASKSVPLVGNYMQSPEFQQYTQAADDWIRAKLRKESGAVIGDDEMAREYKNYFPMPGDSPQVLEQKAAARATAIDAMRGMSGNQAPGGGESFDVDGVQVRKVK